MAVAIETRAITGGVDTHADVHVAAALDPVGGLLGVREFPVTAAGYAGLLGWLGGSERCAWSGSRAPAATAPAWPATCQPPGSGSSRWTARTGRTGAGKASPTRWTRSARHGRRLWPGPRRAERPGRRGGGGPALTVAKRSARSERTQAINQARALIVTVPEDLRARFAAHATADLVTDLASLRPRPGAIVGYHTRIALRELGRRAEFLDGQIVCLDALIMPLVTGHAPGLFALHGVGPDTAALLLVAAGDHPERLARKPPGPPVRRRPDPGLLRQDQTAPPQSRP